MTASRVRATPIPTGGAISLNIFANGTQMMLARASGSVSGTYVTIYSGVPTPLYIDTGDGLTQCLSSGVIYAYKMTDANGDTFSGAVQPILSLDILQEPLLTMMQRLIQGGISNIKPPIGVNAFPASQVVVAMPLTGNPPLPMITINLEVFQQAAIPIGQEVGQYLPNGTWTLTGLAKRVFRITVLAQNAADREFYRDALVAIFQSLLSTVFAPAGLNVSHKFQAFSSQVAHDPSGQAPGFYFADIVLEIEGTSNIAITPTFGIVNAIEFTENYARGATDTWRVPVSG